MNSGQDIPVPVSDLSTIQTKLDRKLFAIDRPIVQYVMWSLNEGLFRCLTQRISSSFQDVCAETRLNENGAEALLGVLCALDLVLRDSNGRYSLTAAGREYFLERSPYFIGDELFAPRERIPGAYLSQTSRWSRIWDSRAKFRPAVRFGSQKRLQNQHVRNLPFCVLAVATGEFDTVRCMVDIAGGSGTFAIPLAQRNPDVRIVLADLPRAIAHVRRRLAAAGLIERIELLPLDLLSPAVCVPQCDGMFVGNFLHGFDDDLCKRICKRLANALEPNGRLWLHEAVWDDDRNGPLITAAWDAAIRVAGGKQRSAPELARLLFDAGLIDNRITRTRGPFALVSASKPTGG